MAMPPPMVPGADDRDSLDLAAPDPFVQISERCRLCAPRRTRIQRLGLTARQALRNSSCSRAMPWVDGSVAAACQSVDDALWSETGFSFLGDAFTRRVEETRRQLGGVDVAGRAPCAARPFCAMSAGVRHGAVDQVPSTIWSITPALAKPAARRWESPDTMMPSADSMPISAADAGTAGTGEDAELDLGKADLGRRNATR